MLISQECHETSSEESRSVMMGEEPHEEMEIKFEPGCMRFFENGEVLDLTESDDDFTNLTINEDEINPDKKEMQEGLKFNKILNIKEILAVVEEFKDVLKGEEKVNKKAYAAFKRIHENVAKNFPALAEKHKTTRTRNRQKLPKNFGYTQFIVENYTKR